MIDHTIIKTKNYAYISVRQAPSLETFIQAAKLFATDPGFRADLNRLCDCSQADMSHITEADFKAFVEFSRSNIPLGAETKVALVAPNEEKRGIFQRFSDAMQTGRFRTFTDPIDAATWITEQPEP